MILCLLCSYPSISEWLGGGRAFFVLCVCVCVCVCVCGHNCLGVGLILMGR